MDIDPKTDNSQEDITEGYNKETIHNYLQENDNNIQSANTVLNYTNQTKCAECDESITIANGRC